MNYTKNGNELKDELSMEVPHSDSDDTPSLKTLTSKGNSEAKKSKIPNVLNLSDENEQLSRLIWNRLKKGNLEALGELYDLYTDELFSYGMAQVHDKTKVMDAIHDLFVDLYKYRTSLSTPVNPKFYLLKALKRKLFRKHFSDHQISLDNSIEVIKINSALSFEEELIEAEHSIEQKEKLRTAYSFLTLRQQKALHLKFTQNLQYNEIAASMNISVATSRTLVYRALSVLRKHCGSLLLLASSTFL